MYRYYNSVTVVYKSWIRRAIRGGVVLRSCSGIITVPSISREGVALKSCRVTATQSIIKVTDQSACLIIMSAVFDFNKLQAIDSIQTTRRLPGKPYFPDQCSSGPSPGKFGKNPPKGVYILGICVTCCGLRILPGQKMSTQWRSKTMY